ncbi:MAG: protein translocase subunit SecD, partial [Proteobacteria bacterium]|nr:protein translocase subunit SecD [Pseudomonadota bacterium]
MNVSLKWRATLVAAFAVLGILFLAPTFLGPEAKLPGFLPKERLHLGLDLQGGMHLVLEVEAEKAVENSLERIAGEIRDDLRDERVRTRSVEARSGELRIVARDAEAADAVGELLKKNYPGLKVASREETDSGVTLTAAFTDSEAKRIEDYAVSQGIETIRNRVDQFGVSEPTIVPQGDRRILIQLPGIKDPERAIKLIGKTAQLEFRLVD